MSVTLYEGALRALLETQEGPVGRYVERIAEAMVVQAELQFDDYFWRANLPARQNIGFSMQGSTATVGYRSDAGSKAQRLAIAEAAGKLDIPPLQTAKERVRGGF